MALNSINTNIAALAAQGNIGKASNMASSSISRLSSGDRIVRASDDVAAMSAGTSLRTNVTTLKMALVNTSQGSSLLQVADGALSQITDILQRQKAIAVQAGSGSLTSAERSFLNQEFQNLTQEVDRLASQTNFNGVTLLDGSLFEVTRVNSADTAAQAASLTLNITGGVADANTLIFGDVTFEIEDLSAPNGITAGNISLGIDLTVNTTLAQQTQAIANVINSTDEVGFSAKAVGTSLILTERAGGASAGGIVFDTNSTVTTTNIGRTYTDNAGAALAAGVVGFQGGADTGIGLGNTQAVGTMGDNILADQIQEFASETLNFSNAVFADGNVVRFDDGQGGNVEFIFIDSSAAAPSTTTTQIGIEIQEYIADNSDENRRLIIDRIVEGINNYSGLSRTAGSGIIGNENAAVDNNAAVGADYFFSQVEARREGDNIVIQTTAAGGLTQVDGTTLLAAITTTAAGAIVVGTGQFDIPAATLNSGVNVNGVNNKDFTGTISGFKVDYRSSNVADISIKVGDRTYSASSVDLSLNYGVDTSNNPPTDATNDLRLTSVEGDYFTIDLQGATQALNITNQSSANLLASRLDKAFSTMTFVQDREIASYTAAGDILTEGVVTGSLTGSSFSLQLSDFKDARIDDIRVTAPVAGTENALIEFDINGVTYRSDSPLGTDIGANGVVRFVSLENGNDVLTFRNGTTTADFSTSARAQAFETALKGAFGIGQGGESIDFQVGVTTKDTLQINIGSVTTNTIFGGQNLDVLTKESAAAAADALDLAIDAVTSVRAEVGALQSRFNFAAANVESSIANQDAARGVLLDTDIAAESTDFATAQVQLQAGISVLAQANLLPQNLLKLIG